MYTEAISIGIKRLCIKLEMQGEHMTRQWNQLNLKPQVPILNQYCWNGHGFMLEFHDIVDDRFVQISFSTDIDGVKFVYLPNSLETDDRIFSLMKEANIKKAPFLPFFIQDQSIFIDEVKNLAGYDAEDKTYKNYIMITDDFWINVVSSIPPRVTYTSTEHDKR